MDQALLIFIKNAELGKVKTRLASTVGNEKALQIYLALLKHTKNIALQTEANRLLFYSSFIETSEEWPNHSFKKLLQEGADLGIRMSNAFNTAFQDHNKVIIIGSDCASLTTEIVQEAFNQLNHHDFVIGPALDGGYYLLGMNTFEPSVFKGIEWSTENVFSSTVERIEALGKNHYLLPQLSDIDYEEDWDKFGWKMSL